MLSELRAGDPEWVGPFRLEGRLGSGEMGVVFLGRSASGRPVAVKVVAAPLAADAPFRRQLAREVAAARRIDGFYTAQVVDARTDSDEPWIATAYVPGPTLREALADGPLPAPAVARLASGLLEGLASIHASRVVHRNLTPDNVILAADGPRVIDFGLARALEHTSTATIVSDPRTDTVAFMSPEQVVGGSVTPASDVFSLGCVLSFAAVGSSPFSGATPEQTMSQILHGQPALDSLPAELSGVVANCLAREPGARPSVAALLECFTSGSAATDGWLPGPVAEMVTTLSAAADTQIAVQPSERSKLGVPGGPTPETIKRPARPSRLLLGAVAGIAGIGLVVGGVATVLALTGGDTSVSSAQGGDGETHTVIMEAFYESPDSEGLPLGVYYSGWHDSNRMAFGTDADEVEHIEVEAPWSETFEVRGPLESFTLSTLSAQPIMGAQKLDYTCRVTVDGEVLLEVTGALLVDCNANKLGGGDFESLAIGDTCEGALVRNPPSCKD